MRSYEAWRPPNQEHSGAPVSAAASFGSACLRPPTTFLFPPYYAGGPAFVLPDSAFDRTAVDDRPGACGKSFARGPFFLCSEPPFRWPLRTRSTSLESFSGLRPLGKRGTLFRLSASAW